MNARILLLLACCCAPFALCAQVNDPFNNPTDISPAGGMVTGSTNLASAQLGEVGISSFAYGRSVWFRLTTPSDLRFNAKTEGSSFDTTLALYRGANLSEVRLIAGNDDASGSVLWSEIDVNIQSGTYWLAVDGFGGVGGNYTLAWQTLSTPTMLVSPPGDDFASAVALTLGDGGITVVAFNQAASLESGEPGSGQRSLWYRFTATHSERLRIRTLDSQFDSQIETYTGTSLGALTLVAVNDDVEFSGGNLEAEVLFGASAGVTYYVRLVARSLTYGSTKLVLAPAKVTGTSNFDAAFGGIWWNPLRDGEGVLIDIGDLPAPNSNDLFLFFSWYTYDPSGNPVYLVGGGNRAITEAFTTDLTFPVVTTRGARFGAAFNPADVIRVPWGTVTLRYRNCNSMDLLFVPAVAGWGAAGSIRLERALSRGPGLTCP
ncbi:MAG: hypothetical protein AB7E72_21225 [Lysobacterales bacterium]